MCEAQQAIHGSDDGEHVLQTQSRPEVEGVEVSAKKSESVYSQGAGARCSGDRNERYGEAAEIHRRQKNPDGQDEPSPSVRRVQIRQRFDHIEDLGRRGLALGGFCVLFRGFLPLF